MDLFQALGMEDQASSIILVGKPTVTGKICSTDNLPYYLAKLKNPVTVYCSMDDSVEPWETDEIYVRKSALVGPTAAEWKFVNPDKKEEGFFVEGWVGDVSVNQEIPIYQETTIREYVKGNRDVKKEKKSTSLSSKIKAKMKEMGK